MPNLTFKSGKAVHPDIVRWWIASANKLKQPRGNGLFDLYLEELNPGDAQRLGLFILDAFITHDTRCPSHEEATAYATANAANMVQAYARWDHTMTYEKAFALLRQQKSASIWHLPRQTKAFWDWQRARPAQTRHSACAPT